MKVMAVNGSPRKGWNTATLLEKALEGAASRGAEIELVHLYDLNYKGCVSCFSCKRIGSPSYGRCAYVDGLTPVLEKIEQVDALLLGSPVYLGAATGEMRSFLERLLYPYIVHDGKCSTLVKRAIPTVALYTMNVAEDQIEPRGYERYFQVMERLLGIVFGKPSETLCVTDTYQFDDYAKYVSAQFDPVAKARRRAEQFPLDCQKAFDLGARLAGGA